MAITEFGQLDRADGEVVTTRECCPGLRRLPVEHFACRAAARGLFSNPAILKLWNSGYLDTSTLITLELWLSKLLHHRLGPLLVGDLLALLVFGSGDFQHRLHHLWMSLAVLEQRFDQHLSAEAVVSAEFL